jgi:hypothetical protein
VDDFGDLHCARCDYDLRMLDPAGVCPECALPIQDSAKTAARPLGTGQRRIHLAAGVLLVVMAVRLLIAVVVASVRVSEGFLIVSYVPQLVEPWPVDTAVTCALRVVHPHSPATGWIIIQALFAANFVLLCAGIVLVTARFSPRYPARAAWLRRTALWSAAASLLMYATIRIGIEHGVRHFWWFERRPVVWFFTIVPPTALAGWTSWLLLRVRTGRWAHALAWTAVVTTTTAASYYEWRSPPRTPAVWVAAAASVISFATLSWMWFALWRRTRPPGMSTGVTFISTVPPAPPATPPAAAARSAPAASGGRTGGPAGC